MKKSLILWFGIVPVVLLGLVLLIPSNRCLLLGILRNESFEDGRPTSYWITALKDEDAAKRHQAAVALCRLGPEAKEAVPALAAALKDDSELVRMNAALALYKIGADGQAAVLALGEALQDDNPMVRIDAALALRQIGPKSEPAAPALVQALRDPKNRRPVPFFHTSVAQLAAAALGRIGPPAKDAVPVLADIFADEDSNDLLRQTAAEALKKIDSQASGD